MCRGEDLALGVPSFLGIVRKLQEDVALSRMCVPRADDMIGPLVTMGVVHGQTACPLKIARTSWRLWVSAVSHAGEPQLLQ